jgi:ferredoxin
VSKKWGLSMAEEYRLRTEGSGWSIIDQATHEPARLDGVPLAAMEAEEAKHMLVILRSIDRVRTASKRLASANRKRSDTTQTAANPQVDAVFEPLRPFKANCARCGSCAGICSQARADAGEATG